MDLIKIIILKVKENVAKTRSLRNCALLGFLVVRFCCFGVFFLCPLFQGVIANNWTHSSIFKFPHYFHQSFYTYLYFQSLRTLSFVLVLRNTHLAVWAGKKPTSCHYLAAEKKKKKHSGGVMHQAAWDSLILQYFSFNVFLQWEPKI